MSDVTHQASRLDPIHLEMIARDLSTIGYVVVPDFFSQTLVSQMTEDFEKSRNSDQFKRAGIGAQGSVKLADEIRRDEILWLDAKDTEPLRREILQIFDDLRIGLNQQLYLGLWELEAHYAHYPSGGFYRRHLDRFAADDTRMVSLVTYFNADWTLDQGGELLIYANPGDSEPAQVVEPRSGTLVCFRSDLIEHEVRPARASRRSLAGWFRRRPI